MIKKASAIIQIVIIGYIVAYGTYHLFMGNFVLAYSTFPFLLFYWVWVVARKRKSHTEDREEEEEEEEQ